MSATWDTAAQRKSWRHALGGRYTVLCGPLHSFFDQCTYFSKDYWSYWNESSSLWSLKKINVDMLDVKHLVAAIPGLDELITEVNFVMIIYDTIWNVNRWIKLVTYMALFFLWLCFIIHPSPPPSHIFKHGFLIILDYIYIHTFE